MHPLRLLNAMSALGASERSAHKGVDPSELRRSWDMYDRWHWSPGDYLDDARSRAIDAGQGPQADWSPETIDQWESNYRVTPQFVERIWPHEQEKHRSTIPSFYQVKPSLPRPE
tara:strand:+ start:7521 stop:7862 length:342 start_codon:yes stop_codon:yes gene_type:complete